MSTNHVQFERRAGQRFDFHLPVTVQISGREGTGSGFTQNLSSKGALFQTSFPVEDNDTVELTVVMPSEITLGESMPVRCRGSVLRVTHTGTGSLVAVHFAGYDFLPQQDDPPARRSFTAPPDHDPESEAGLTSHTFSMRSLI